MELGARESDARVIESDTVHLKSPAGVTDSGAGLGMTKSRFARFVIFSAWHLRFAAVWHVVAPFTSGPWAALPRPT